MGFDQPWNILKSKNIPLILKSVGDRLARTFLKPLKVQGATLVRENQSGILTYRLHSRTWLGTRGDELQVSNDSVLKFNIENFGIYEKRTIGFFREVSESLTEKVYFVDIGANCGLISRGVAFRNSKIQEIIAIEPLAHNRIPLKSNLDFLRTRYQILDYALGSTRGETDIYVPRNQFGSATLNQNSVLNMEYSKLRVKVDLPENFVSKFPFGDSKVMIKCDIEGNDLTLLGEFPETFWHNVVALSVEIDATYRPRIDNVLDFINQMDAIGLRLVRFGFHKFQPDTSKLNEFVGRIIANPNFTNENLHLRKF